MKVLYLHQYFTTPSMPGGTRSYEMARRLVAMGHEVNVITSDRSGRSTGGWYESEEAGIRVHWLPVSYSNSMGKLKRIRAFAAFALAAGPRAARLGGDVVFATSTPLSIAIPGIMASRLLRVPMVFEVRDLWPELPIAVGALRGRAAKGLAHGLELLAYKNSKRIVALSPGMKAGVERRGYPEERVEVIPNGADLDLFAPDDEAAQHFRDSLPWLGDRPLVLYAGTLGRINGVSYLARIASSALALDPEIRFLVVGNGYEKEQVRKEARELEVLDESFFMLDELPKQEVRAAFSAATISTSLFIDLQEMWNNSANKVFDTLASGTPLAINYRGWQAELLERTGAGIVLPASDPGTAAAHLVTVLRDEEWVAKAGASARKLAEDHFSRDKLACQLESVLRAALDDEEMPSPDPRSRRKSMSSVSRGVKRLFDVVASALLLVLLSPLMLCLTVVIAYNLGRPVIFAQPRPGLGGRVFTILKFRSMLDYRDNEGRHLSDGDRLTRFGRWLRSTSLDELPELINVLKGEMSIVGPRPLKVEYLERYDSFQARRHEVKPGITGWAQVNGRNRLSWEEKFSRDVWYVDNQSLMLDLRILLMTLTTVFDRLNVSAAGHDTMPEFQGAEDKTPSSTLAPGDHRYADGES